MQPLIRKHSYLNHRYPVGSIPGEGGGGVARGQNLEHIQKVVFLCLSFLEVYISESIHSWTKGVPYLPYPTFTILYPILPLPYPLPYPSLPYPCPTLFYPTPTHPISYPYYYPYLYSYPYLTHSTPPIPTLPSKNSNTCT